MEAQALVQLIQESGKPQGWLAEQVSQSGGWRQIVYGIGQERLLAQVDTELKGYQDYFAKIKEANPEAPDDQRREYIKQEWMRPQLNDYYYKRKRDMDQVVYSMLRLTDIGLAEELYLRLKNKECQISDLAFDYSLGPEKYTKGIVGPMPIAKTAEQIRALSTTANRGNLNKPVVVQNLILITVVEHVIEATLTPELENQLLEELMNIELQKVVNAMLGQA
jgi:hypothetical protein